MNYYLNMTPKNGHITENLKKPIVFAGHELVLQRSQESCQVTPDTPGKVNFQKKIGYVII